MVRLQVGETVVAQPEADTDSISVLASLHLYIKAFPSSPNSNLSDIHAVLRSASVRCEQLIDDETAETYLLLI